jgi:hypothetical protein
LDSQCNTLLSKLCKKYDNLNEVDKLASVALKVDSIKLVMQDNVDMALQNCVKLESIEKAAGISFPPPPSPPSPLSFSSLLWLPLTCRPLT